MCSATTPAQKHQIGTGTCYPHPSTSPQPSSVPLVLPSHFIVLSLPVIPDELPWLPLPFFNSFTHYYRSSPSCWPIIISLTSVPPVLHAIKTLARNHLKRDYRWKHWEIQCAEQIHVNESAKYACSKWTSALYREKVKNKINWIKFFKAYSLCISGK